MEPMKPQMTAEELAEMVKLRDMQPYTYRAVFELAYKTGYITGKLSALTHITNHSTLLNGDITAGEAESTGLSKKRVAAPRKTGRL